MWERSWVTDKAMKLHREERFAHSQRQRKRKRFHRSWSLWTRFSLLHFFASDGLTHSHTQTHRQNCSTTGDLEEKLSLQLPRQLVFPSDAGCHLEASKGHKHNDHHQTRACSAYGAPQLRTPHLSCKTREACMTQKDRKKNSVACFRSF